MSEERRRDYPDILSEIRMVRENQDALIKELKSRVDHHDEVLNGNGQVGLKTKAEIVDSGVRRIDSTLRKHFEDDESNFRILFKSLYLGMGGLGVLMFALRFFFK